MNYTAIARLLTISLCAAPALFAVNFSLRVVNSSNGAAIPSAGVSILPLNDASGGTAVYGRTDANGQFVSTGITAGTHLVQVNRSGYGISGVGMDQSVEVKPGQDTELTIFLQPLGILIGRVLDQYGDPVRGAVVHVLNRFDLLGAGESYEGSEVAESDDLGEYRIAGVQPGKHFLAAEYESDRLRRTNGSQRDIRWPRSGGLVLFPGTTDSARAEQVQSINGQITRAGDLRLDIQRAARVSGRVSPFVPGTRLTLVRAGPRLGLNLFAFQGIPVEADGSFTYNTLPGIYTLTAFSYRTGKTSLPVPIDVREGSDVENLKVELSTKYEINGRIAFEGPTPPDFSMLSLSLLGPRETLDSTGLFHAQLDGPKASWNLQNLPAGWYIKSILVAGRLSTGRILDVSPGITDLVIALSPDGATVNVQVEPGTPPMRASYVVLLPEKGTLPTLEELLQNTPDAAGNFSISSVPPGTYRLFALTAVNWILLMRPDMLMEMGRQSAPLIEVSPGEHKNITVAPTKISF